MKKFTLLSGLIVLLSLLSSCASTSSVDIPYETNVTIQGADVVDFQIVPQFCNFLRAKGTNGYTLVMKNKSSEVVKIIWENSSISYGMSSSTIFQEGQKYAESTTPLPPLVLPIKGMQTRNIFSATQVVRDTMALSGWRMEVIPYFDTTVTICVSSSAGESYYILDIKADNDTK